MAIGTAGRVGEGVAFTTMDRRTRPSGLRVTTIDELEGRARAPRFWGR